MFKKSKRSFRQRTRHSDSDDNDGGDVQQIPHETTPKINDNVAISMNILTIEQDADSSNLSFKSANNKNDRKTKLSFEEDEEEGKIFFD